MLQKIVLTDTQVQQVELHLNRRRLQYLEAYDGCLSTSDRREIAQLHLQIPQTQVRLAALGIPEVPDDLPRLVTVYCAQFRHTGDPAYGG